MKMSNEKVECLNLIDSKEINEKEFNLGNSSMDKYFKLSNNVWTVDFVGIVFKNTDKSKETIRSFPKYYFENDLENKNISQEDLDILENTLINICKFDNESFNIEDKNNFPINAYLYICSYFKKYGLYHKDVTKYYKGYGGQIDWKRTVASSDKILNNKNLLFLPFVNKKIEYEDVFITECMNYVLTDGYNCFGQFFNIGIKYKKVINNRIFYDNRVKLIKKLVSIKRSHFKNIEIKLIDNIIKYIKWLSIKSEDVVITTKKFEVVWEIMVKEYLNNFFNYDLINGKIYFDKREVGDHNKFVKFSKNEKQYLSRKIMDEEIRTADYLLIDDKQETVFLLEFNYYKSLEDFNAQRSNKKVLSRNMLQEYLQKQGKNNYKIVEGFVLPSYENKVVVSISFEEKTVTEKIKTYECSLKVKDVMKYYALKK